MTKREIEQLKLFHEEINSDIAFFIQGEQRLPVRLEVKKWKDDNAGDFKAIQPKKGKAYFRIRVDQSLPYWAARETLMHEWAHLLSAGPTDTPYHGRRWGHGYSILWRLYGVDGA